MPHTLQISLPRMHFYAYHGVLPQERIVGGDYEVSINLTIRHAKRAIFADDINGTVNYAEVFALVQEEMNTPSQLLEHVAGRIVQQLFTTFRRVAATTVTVRKVNPPLAGDNGGACVTLFAQSPFAWQLKVLILDFDGTLADTSAGIITTMAATFAELGIPRAEDEAVRQTIGLPLCESIARLTRLSGTKLDKAVLTYRRLFEIIGNHAVKIFPKVRETLATLTARGIRVAVATSRGHASVCTLCESIGIAPYVSFYVAEDDVVHKKPEAEAVRMILSHFGIRPNEALVVGDTSFDILMGENAGCPTCGVTYGNHSAAQLAAAGATATVNDFGQLLHFF